MLAGHDPVAVAAGTRRRTSRRASERWNFVLDGMVAQGWLPGRRPGAAGVPGSVPAGGAAGRRHPRRRPRPHLQAGDATSSTAHGITEQEINTEGLHDHHHDRPEAPGAGRRRRSTKVLQGPAGQPADRAGRRSTRRPAAILAYYGGSNGLRHRLRPGPCASPARRSSRSCWRRRCRADARPSGSAAPTTARRRRSSRAWRSATPRAYSCDRVHACKTAMTKSINTVFYQIGVDVGPAAGRRRRAPGRASRPTSCSPTRRRASRSATRRSTRSTWRRRSRRSPPTAAPRRRTWCPKVTAADGRVLYDRGATTGRAGGAASRWPATSPSRCSTWPARSGHRARRRPRRSPAKTGTVQHPDANGQNKDAWMVGYTPSLSTAVWVGTDDSDPIKTAAGRPIFGRMLPGSIWQALHERRPARHPASSSPRSSRSARPSARRLGRAGRVGRRRLRRREVRRRGQGRRRSDRDSGDSDRRPTARATPTARRLGRPQRLRQRLEQRLEQRRRGRLRRRHRRRGTADRRARLPQRRRPGARPSDSSPAAARDEPAAGPGTSPPAGRVVPDLDRAARRHGQPGRRRPARAARAGRAQPVLDPAAGGAAARGRRSWRSAGCGKAPCLQQYVTTDGGLALDWRNNRQYVAMCYSDTVPLYGIERLDSGARAVPRLVGARTRARPPSRCATWSTRCSPGSSSTANARLADGWLVAGRQRPCAAHRRCRWSSTSTSPRSGWRWPGWWWSGRCARLRPVAGRGTPRSSRCRRWWPCTPSPTSTRSPSRAPPPACSRCARRRPVLAGVLLGVGGAVKLYPLLLLLPVVLVALRRRDLRAGGAHGRGRGRHLGRWSTCRSRWPGPRAGGSSSGSTRRGPPTPTRSTTSSAYFTGWPGFDGPLAAGQAPVVLNARESRRCSSLCCAGVAAAGAARAPRAAAARRRWASWSSRRSCWSTRCGARSTRCGWCRWRCSRCPRWRLLLAWMAIDALVWVPRMFYYLGRPRSKGLPPDWFLGAVVVRDRSWWRCACWSCGRVLRPETDPVRHGRAATTTRTGRPRCPRPSRPPPAGRCSARPHPRRHPRRRGEPIGDQRRRHPQEHHEQHHQQRRPAPHPDHHGLRGEPAPMPASRPALSGRTSGRCRCPSPGRRPGSAATQPHGTRSSTKNGSSHSVYCGECTLCSSRNPHSIAALTPIHG